MTSAERQEAEAHEDNIYFKEKDVKDDEEIKLQSEDLLGKMKLKLQAIKD
jgi:hypothetical protein